jgi:hypothetical protein
LGQDWLKNTFILSPVFAVMVTAGYYLWRDYQNDGLQDQGQVTREVFGNMSFSDNNVKRKTSESVLWNPVVKDEPLYYLDSIRTGTESYAVIKLKDGSIIELNENSLIVLEKNSDQLSVDFKTGDIRTKQASKNLTFTLKDTTIQAQGADLKLKSDANKNSQVVVTKGKALMVDGLKNRRDLGPESLLSIDQKGQTQTIAVPLVLLSPADKAQIVSSLEETKFSFTWTVHDRNLREEFLEVSQDPNFLRLKTVTIKAHQAATAPIKRGRNFWRVGWKPPRTLAASESQLFYSEIRMVALAEDQRVSLIYPADDTVFETTPTDSEIEFTWKAEGDPKTYVFEISDSASFQRIKQTHKVTEPKFKTTNLASGIYFWRVTALGSRNESLGQSSVSSFEVSLTLPALPVLVKPDENYIWASQAPVRMEWKNVEGAPRYRVTVSKDKEAKQIVKAVTVTHSPYAWSPLKPGSYFWTVESIDSSTRAFTRSQTRTFTVTAVNQEKLISLLLPADQSEVNRERKEVLDPVSFEWRAEKLQPANYTLLISKSPGFEKHLKTENIVKNQVTVRLNESATYFWKIVWTNPASPEQTETSATFQLKYNIPDGLPSPELVEPVKDAIIKVPVNQPVELTWSPVHKGKKYRVVVERYDTRLNSKIPVLDKITEELKATTLALGEGSYEWRAYTIDEKEIQGLPSETRKFQIQLIEALLAPKLRPPEIK